MKLSLWPTSILSNRQRQEKLNFNKNVLNWISESSLIFIEFQKAQFSSCIFFLKWKMKWNWTFKSQDKHLSHSSSKIPLIYFRKSITWFWKEFHCTLSFGVPESFILYMLRCQILSDILIMLKRSDNLVLRMVNNAPNCLSGSKILCNLLNEF